MQAGKIYRCGEQEIGKLANGKGKVSDLVGKQIQN